MQILTSLVNCMGGEYVWFDSIQYIVISNDVAKMCICVNDGTTVCGQFSAKNVPSATHSQNYFSGYTIAIINTHIKYQIKTNINNWQILASRMRGWRHTHFYCSYIFTLFYHFYASYPPDICICAGLYTQDLICELGWLTYWIFFWIFDIEILNILLRDLGGQTNRVGEIL